MTDINLGTWEEWPTCPGCEKPLTLDDVTSYAYDPGQAGWFRCDNCHSRHYVRSMTLYQVGDPPTLDNLFPRDSRYDS